MLVLSKWSPDPVTCDYCETHLTFNMEDVIYKGQMFYVDCCECKNEIRIKHRLPQCWQDCAIEKEKNK
jgi:hypothetical protein